MGINDISLTTGMRSNLISLQKTSSLLNRTQERLATGKKVNTALDNPTSFFAAQTLNMRASNLTGLKDSMSNAVSTIQAANDGITGITRLIDAAKGLAQSALATSDTTAINSYAAQFDTILGQITQMGGDSGYSGTNFLASQNLTVIFDSTSGNSLQINGFNGSSTGLGLHAANTASSTQTVTSTVTTLQTATVSSYDSIYHIVKLGSGTVSAALGNLMNANPFNYRIVDSVTGAIATGDSVDAMGYQPPSIGGDYWALVVSGTFHIGDAVTIQYDASGFNHTTGAPNSLTVTTPGSNSWLASGGIQASINELNSAVTTLQNYSAGLSSNLSIVTTREDFTTSMVNDLQVGVDELTLADMNQEGASMLMLQTRESLGTTSLSLSSQAAQTVLDLF